AYSGIPLLVRALPPVRHLDGTSIPLAISIQPDPQVFAFCFALCLLTALLFGLGPAFASAPSELHAWLKSGRISSSRGRQGLVVFQVALCTVLLVAAGLFLRTFDALRRIDPGFDSAHVVSFSADPTLVGYDSAQSDRLRTR